jgi:hypothetical protein
MRLIDADALLEGREDHELISTHMIWNAPTIDAVPVVRCRACKNWDLDWSSNRDPDLHYCWMIDSFTDDKFYCKDGDRRTNNGK